MHQELVRKYYENLSMPQFFPWRLSRKQVRIVMHNGRIVKLNTPRDRVNTVALRKICLKHAPIHVYMSVLNFLFPEKAGLKNTGERAHPIGGEYVIDVDNFLFRGIVSHEHSRTWVCDACLEIARRYAIVLSELAEENYSDTAIVFSGSRGFHIHVLDFEASDWVSCDEHDPVKSQEAARRRYTLHLSRRLDTCFDEQRFTFFVDPMRTVPVPQTLNASTGLVCRLIGSRMDLERKSIARILDEANPALAIWPCHRSC